ncbi:hypothetical protein, partial [Burkholderia multivorans]|uniref:hypothetical protein n=1 Tax=Burkholderia multivorans TaxID=87883 RepID=UPI001EFA14D9
MTGTFMSLVTSPLSDVVTGKAGGSAMCWPGAIPHADSSAQMATENAAHARRTAGRLLIGTEVSNGWWLFMSLFSIVKQKYLCEERAGSQPSGRPRTGFATAGSRDPGASRPA